MNNRSELLAEATRITTEDRNKTYGPPKEQLSTAEALIETYRSARRTAIRSGREPYNSGHDRAIEDCLQKISRIAHGEFKPDNYVDLCAYGAIAFECHQTLIVPPTELFDPEEFMQKHQIKSGETVTGG